MEISELKKKFSTMPLDKLRETNNILVEIIKQKQRFQNALCLMDFSEGDKVQMKKKFRNSKPYDAIGVVKALKRTKLQVMFDNVRWSIPPTMLEKVEEK